MSDQALTIIYDGQCPFCASYVAMVQLKKTVGQVVLVDARSDDPRVTASVEAGHDLDRGMVVLWHDETFFGDRAVHLLATLTAADGGIGSRLQRAVFRSPRRAARIYPVLAWGRRAFLRLIGRRPIAGHRKETSAGRE